MFFMLSFFFFLLSTATETLSAVKMFFRGLLSQPAVRGWNDKTDRNPQANAQFGNWVKSYRELHAHTDGPLT